MLIQCNNCKKEFKIPEEKVPDVPKFAVKCPACGIKISVNRSIPEMHTKDSISPSDDILSIEPEMYPPGSKVTFVFVDNKDIESGLKKYLDEKGYIVSSASNIKEAVAKLNLNRYDMVIFSYNKEALEIMKEIDRWPGNLRRQINVIAIGEGEKTFDPNIEFLLGVNSYISQIDLKEDNFYLLLDNAIKKHEEFLVPWKYIDTRKENSAES